MYIIKIKTHNDHGCWLRSLSNQGDPDRTLIKSSAKKFAIEKDAIKVIEKLTKKYPNRAFEIDGLSKERSKE